jgi:hypothetical protein
MNMIYGSYVPYPAAETAAVSIAAYLLNSSHLKCCALRDAENDG